MCGSILCTIYPWRCDGNSLFVRSWKDLQAAGKDEGRHMRKCTFCGAELPPQARFCGACGQVMDADSSGDMATTMSDTPPAPLTPPPPPLPPISSPGWSAADGPAPTVYPASGNTPPYPPYPPSTQRSQAHCQHRRMRRSVAKISRPGCPTRAARSRQAASRCTRHTHRALQWRLGRRTWAASQACMAHLR